MATNEITPPGFALFGHLPPELRLLIWKEALAVDCVWAAVLAERETSRMDGRRSYPIEARFRMRLVGPSPPHLVGQTCHEARATMKAVFGRPFRGPRGPKLIVGDEQLSPSNDGGARERGAAGEDEEGEEEGPYYWLNPATTVLVLHNPKETRRLLDGFAPGELARLRHLAVFWAHWAAIAALNARLRRDCPNLQTLIVEKGRLCYEKLPDHLRYPALDAPTAERYARLARPGAGVVGDHGPESREFRARTWVWETEGAEGGGEGRGRGRWWGAGGKG
ncbi:hypothetical protein PG985_003564 [Apiospora marii]|uniref:uncharacterized protein n=1 Tax=Apiospora marii TaxID=335849 RepID=UPI00312D65C5